MRRLLALLTATLLGLTPAATLAPTPALAADPPSPLTFLPLGDSIACGATLALDGSPVDCTDGYRARLGELLDLAGVPHEFVVAAHGGWRCADWNTKVNGVSRARTAVAAAQPDIVIITCGTNDAGSGASTQAMNATYRELQTEILIGWPTARILASWPQYSRSPGLAAAEALVADGIFLATFGWQWHGFGPGGRVIGVVDHQNIPPIYLDQQGVHPTRAGYALMGEQIYRKLAADPAYGWPTAHLAPMCGLMWGRPGYYPAASYTPCTIPAS